MVGVVAYLLIPVFSACGVFPIIGNYDLWDHSGGREEEEPSFVELSLASSDIGRSSLRP